jgi:peroxiredoxin Q/BCP
MRRFLGILTTCGLSFAGGRSTGAAGGLREDDPAPDFALEASDGQTYELSDLLADGKFVVIAWFPRAFTPGCTAECKSLREANQALQAFDAAVFAASVDTPERNHKFAENLELDFPILSDPKRSVARAYGVVTDAQGVAKRWTFYIGPDGKIRQIDKKVNTREHGQNVAEMLARLEAPRRKVK